MKRQLLIWFTAVLVLSFGVPAAASDVLGTGMKNSSHDLGGSAQPGGGERMCLYCHTPHNGNGAAQTAVSFETYSSTSTAIGEPGGVSRICLGCHDGSIAMSVYGFFPPDDTVKSTYNRPDIGIKYSWRNPELAKHHPIGIDYHLVELTDRGIKPSMSALGGSNPSHLTIEDLLWNGRVECTTCHDVHNMGKQEGKFTWVEDRRSDLCRTCHDK